MGRRTAESESNSCNLHRLDDHVDRRVHRGWFLIQQVVWIASSASSEVSRDGVSVDEQVLKQLVDARNDVLVLELDEIGANRNTFEMTKSLSVDFVPGFMSVK